MELLEVVEYTMSRIYLGSDFHIGHKNIHKFRCKEKGFLRKDPLDLDTEGSAFLRDFTDEAEHREWLFEYINTTITKRDTMILLGDICFNEEALLALSKLPGKKVLIMGNHEYVPSTPEGKQLMAKTYVKVHGLLSYKGYWISHCPVHPDELRGKKNLNGHVHYKPIADRENYFSCCVENLMETFGTPIALFDDIKEMFPRGTK